MDNTVRVFDEFYDVDLSVSANDYEVVYAFFRENTSNVSAARNYAETLFRVSAVTGVNVMELLDSFRGADSMKITLTMAYYLNSIGNKNVMYGASNLLPPNAIAQRNVIL